MDRPGVITGLVSELDCLRVFAAAERPPARCGGLGAQAAGKAARALIAEGCRGLLSFGIAGGLDPALNAGAAVIADRILAAADRSLATDEAWRQSLVESVVGAGGAVTVASIAASEWAVTSVAAKRDLWQRSGAAAVDMESLAVAEAAAEAGLPFLAVRVVADTAQRAVPAWVMHGVGADGGLRPGVVVAGLLTRPWALPAVVGLARDSRLAHAGLRRVAALAGPFFGLR